MATPTHRLAPAPATIALLCFVGPVLTVHMSYALSIAGGFVAVCIPYLDGCTSISATGRHGPGYVLFKAGMLLSVLLLIVYWRLCRDWLLEAGDVDGPALRSLLRLGSQVLCSSRSTPCFSATRARCPSFSAASGSA